MVMQVKQVFFWAVLLCAAGLSACAPVQETPATGGQVIDTSEQKFERSSIVTIGSPRLDPERPSSISWGGEILVFDGSHDAGKRNIALSIRRACEQQVAAKGYHFLPTAGDFQLYAIAVVDTPEHAARQILQEAGFDPGLAGKDDKGSLILELRQGRAVRWRGVVQILAVPDLDETQRFNRISFAVGQLIYSWPGR